MKSTDPCRAPACRWHDQCPLRPLPQAAPTPAATPTPGKQPPPAATFNARLDVWPHMAELHLNGHLDARGTAHAVADLKNDLDGFAGLLVTIDSRGGLGPGGDQLGTLIADAGRTIPVVTFAARACSAALGPFLAGSVRLCSPDATIGCYGGVVGFCDGLQPGIILNRQSPHKPVDRDQPPDILLVTGRMVFNAQQQYDEGFEKDLATLAGYVGRAPDQLEPYLDGRSLTAQEAVGAGLAHQVVATEGAAFNLLLNLARTGRKQSI